MVSLKTKNSRKKRLFLIVFIPLFGSALALSANSLIANSGSTFLVKDESIVASSAPEESGTPPEEDLSLATDNKPLKTIYTVATGDTLSGIAEKFDISTNTIRWANNISAKGVIHVGDKLTILPVTGIEYTVKKGDTLSGIAAKFDVKQADILDYNDIEADKIKQGLVLIIPDGEPIIPPKPVAKPAVKKVEAQPSVTQTVEVEKEKDVKVGTNSSGEYYIVPAPGSRLSQRLHDGTAVDMAIKVGSTIRAAASGVVTVVKDSNVWNGGYGYYLMIKHDNGTQTLYAHLSRIDVEVGQEVEQGEAIALSGRTGRVTGPHLHFEVRGATNPFAKDKVGTNY